MAWLELKLDLTRTANALERIAAVLERAYPLPQPDANPRPLRVFDIDPAAIAEAEEEADRRRAAGTEEAPDVVP